MQLIIKRREEQTDASSKNWERGGESFSKSSSSQGKTPTKTRPLQSKGVDRQKRAIGSEAGDLVIDGKAEKKMLTTHPLEKEGGKKKSAPSVRQTPITQKASLAVQEGVENLGKNKRGKYV